MTRGVFVTGTDTGVGKTLVACTLLHALRGVGVGALPMKPVAAGAIHAQGRWVNEDTLALLAAAGLDAARADSVTPILLREPMAPHIAAAREAREIRLEPLMRAFHHLSAGGDFLVVEGVGGFQVPLGPGIDTVDLARAFGLPVVMVVGMRLGCLNHALLTVRAIEAAGLALAGWIANGIDPHMAAAQENIDALRSRIAAPLLGSLPFGHAPDARLLAARLDVSTLLA
jgi:dethiobiotin synthetase